MHTILKLYYCPGHLSFAPHVILNELGKPFELLGLSLKNGDNKLDEFKKINPKGKVPVLITDNEILTESSAILLYLAMSYPESRLLPSTTEGVAKTVEWLNWLSCSLTGVLSLNFHPSRFTEDGKAYEGIRSKGRIETIEVFNQINNRLENRTWALKEEYSIVDPVLFIYFKWGNLLNLDMTQYNHWVAHVERMLLRPAVQKTLSTEGISIWS